MLLQNGGSLSDGKSVIKSAGSLWLHGSCVHVLSIDLYQYLDGFCNCCCSWGALVSVLWAGKAALREIKLPYGLLCYFKAKVCSFFHIKILSRYKKVKHLQVDLSRWHYKTCIVFVYAFWQAQNSNTDSTSGVSLRAGLLVRSTNGRWGCIWETWLKTNITGT